MKRKGRLKGFIKKHKLLTCLISVILIGAIVAGGVAVSKGKSNGVSYSFIRTTTLTKGTLEDTITTTGTVESAKTSNVTTSLNYTVKSINVAVGDTVEKGDIICTLDTEELESQIEKEKNNLSKAKDSAQSSYNSAKTAYNTAKSNYDSYSSAYNSAKSEYESAKTPYNKAVNSLKSNQSAYDSALSAYNNAGSQYVKALSNYNSAVSAYKSNKSSANKSKLISAANAYMKAAQNYYGKCSVGTYDISDSSSSSQSISTGKMSGDTASVSAGGTSSVSVTKTADEICESVISNVKTLTGKTLSNPSGSNTLYKLYSKAQSLRKAKDICNFSALESAYTAAKNAYTEAKQTYNQYKDSVTQSKEQLTRAAEELKNASSSDTLDDLKAQLDECNLKAGQSGTVTALNATVGSSVNMNTSVATIQDLDNLTVSITIEEADINNAEIGMTCRVTSDASETALSATLTRIDPVSNEGSFGATVTVNEKSDDIYIGMNASVDIITSSSEDVYQVPIDAVGTEGDIKYVYRQTGGSGTDMEFEKVTVTTGKSNDYYIEISSSELSEGDVIRSSADISEGIETISPSENDGNGSGGAASSLFGGSGNRRGNMPQGAPFDSNSMPRNSGSSGDGMPSPPSGGMPGGNNG